jgi:3-hydroxypropanoate dehydrogenase
MGTLQGAYFILAVRSLGLDAGGMGGFDNAKVDEEFFKGTTVKSNFLCNVGYGDLSGIKGPRLHRYDFDEVCTII